MSGRIFAAVVAVCVVVGLGTAAVAQPEPDPSKQCKKGRTTGTASAHEADTNQNGFVCVNQETGEVSDDKGQFAGDEDAFDNDLNDNGIVCFNEQSGVVTDDDLSEDFTSSCPPGFVPFPAVLFP